MFSFLKKLFGSKPERDQLVDPQAKLEFDRKAEDEDIHSFHADADVHRLMIKATSIRKTDGYTAAIRYLQELAEYYRREQNTAMIVCMNKLIPYMKRDESLSKEDTRQYLEAYISGVPDTDPYFLKLHIIMAKLLAESSTEKAISYLEDFLDKNGTGINSYDHQLVLAGLYIESKILSRAKQTLRSLRGLLSEGLERTDHIKKERKWQGTCALLDHELGGDSCRTKYLFHRFMEFALDMARVLDPMQIRHFHERKDLYYKGKRGFIEDERYRETIKLLGLENREENLISDIYGFCFEEMPGLLGVSKNQMDYRPGTSESLEELREKKLFARKTFTETALLEDSIKIIIQKYLDWSGTDKC